MKRHRHLHRQHLIWRYKNLTIAALGIVIAILLGRNETFHEFLLNFGSLGYVGAFIAGMLFVSMFTVATGAVILFIFAEQLHPIELGLIAGLGGVVGDLLIFHYLRDNLSSELADLYTHFDPKRHFSKLLHSRYFNWTLPVLGAIIIASPFPDELGISLMGLSKISTLKFILISFVLDTLGVFLIVSASLALNS